METVIIVNNFIKRDTKVLSFCVYPPQKWPFQREEDTTPPLITGSLIKTKTKTWTSTPNTAKPGLLPDLGETWDFQFQEVIVNEV